MPALLELAGGARGDAPDGARHAFRRAHRGAMEGLGEDERVHVDASLSADEGVPDEVTLGELAMQPRIRERVAVPHWPDFDLFAHCMPSAMVENRAGSSPPRP